MTDPSELSTPASKLPDFGFQILLARRNSGVVIGDVHLGQPFDLRGGIHAARDAAADTFGDESLEVTLLDQFASIVTQATPVSAAFEGLSDQQAAERIVELLAVMGPHVHRAIVGSDDATSQRLCHQIKGVSVVRRDAEQSIMINHYSG